MLTFRKASEGDIPEIVSFTMDTWDWGDYIPEVIGRWVAEGRAYVAVLEGRIAAVAAMRESIAELYKVGDPVVRALILSIELDEQKHYQLVKTLQLAARRG